MKHLLIDIERFRLGGYSKLFQDVICALMNNNTILSEEATTEALRSVFEEGMIAAQEQVNEEEVWNKLIVEL